MRLRLLFSTLLLPVICLLVCFAPAGRAQSANQWRQLTPLEGGNVLALLEQGGRVYAGVAVRGVFVSTDGSRTWREANSGLGNAAGSVTVNALAAAGANIFATTNTGIYRSSDNAQSWALVGADGQDTRSLTTSVASIFAGGSTGRVFRSGDNGQTWVERARIPNNPAVNVLAVLGSDLFAGTARGLFRSSDQGQSWTAVTTGLPNNGAPVVSALAVNGNTLYLGTNLYRDAANNALPQVYASGNGQDWMAVGDSIRIPLHGAVVGLPNVVGLAFVGTSVYALTSFGLVSYDGQAWTEPAVTRGLPVGVRANTLLSSSDRLLLSTPGGVYALADGGRSWTANDAGLTAASVIALAVSGNTILVSAGASGLFRSNDDGRTWTAVKGVDNGSGRPFQVTSLAARGENIYAGINLAGGVFRTNDGGVSWTQINGGFRSSAPSIPDLAVSGEDVYALSSGFVYKLNAEGNGWTELTPSAINASRLAASGTNVYAATATTLLRSTDGGRNFAPVDIGDEPLSITALGARGNNVYLSALTRGSLSIFVSNNNGSSFTPSRSFAVLTTFAFSGDALYATGSGGVYSSGNNGAYWTPVNAGLVNRIVNRLAVKGETLLAGTSAYGVYAATNPRPGALANVSAASFRPDGNLAGNSIVTAFGTNLATTPQGAGTPLPFTLAGTQVVLSDGRGQDYNARLFFVSPGQVNYEMRDFPDGTELLVTIISGDGSSSVGLVTIARVAPGLFAANANGQGVAAAVVQRTKADGAQSFEPVARFDMAQQSFVAVPIDLGAETDQVFLVLNGTGLRFRSGLSAVTARIGGTNAEVTFAGAQGQFVGLDQVNVRLPRSLTGRGDVEVALTVDGQPANVVRVNIK